MPKVPEEKRISASHVGKRQVVGNRAGQVAPAWRTNAGPSNQSRQENGSRIFISKLPVDVGEKEVEELFRITVGPLREAFLVYNSQGRSKGMAVVAFQRPGDALVAKAKYDGKVVDGRKSINIDIITDGKELYKPPPPPKSLFDRLAPANSIQAPVPNNAQINANSPVSIASRPLMKAKKTASAAPVASAAPIPPRRLRQKKGPKRLNKRMPVTIADLDKEMEDYRASAPELDQL